MSHPETVLSILRIPVRCGAGAILQIQRAAGRRVSASTFANYHAAQGHPPPVRFASSLHRDATQVAASSTRYRAASYDLAAPAERKWSLASVGIRPWAAAIADFTAPCSLLPTGSTSAATSLRSPTPLSQCQNLPACTEPHFLTIAIRTRALPHTVSFAPRPLKTATPSCTQDLLP